jgi:hypothetical protein
MVRRTAGRRGAGPVDVLAVDDPRSRIANDGGQAEGFGRSPRMGVGADAKNPGRARAPREFAWLLS